ncbi:alpha/beta hydrolase [Marinobacteraceae bacterium S3BR75-40.1]
MNGRVHHRKLKINGIRFHVAQSAPPDSPKARQPGRSILCLHGFPEGWMSWRPLMQRLPDVAIYAPDLRGYPRTDRSDRGYDVPTLLDDIRGLIEKLGLNRPLLLGHDWGGALAWTFAHLHSDLISQVAVINCPHPKTLVRAVLHFEDFQTLRIPWVPPFQVPLIPEALLTTGLGRYFLRLSFTLRAGSEGKMDRDLVRMIVSRFNAPEDLRGPINYYRDVVWRLLWPSTRHQLAGLYSMPISVPATLIWGLEDRALSAKVAQQSHEDAGTEVAWRPLEGVGHFVPLEAPDALAREVGRLMAEIPRVRADRQTGAAAVQAAS